MRNRKIIIVIFFGFLFGITLASYNRNKEILGKKIDLNNSKKITSWVPAPVGKHLAALKVHIDQPADISEDSNDSLNIKARIAISNKISGPLSYHWDLPKGVVLLEGVKEDQLQDLSAGDIVELEIKVSGFDKTRQKLISLQASTQSGGITLGNSSVIASRPEDTWEAAAPEMRAAAEQRLGTTRRSAQFNRE